VAFCAYVPSDAYYEVPCGCGKKWCFTCSEDDHRPSTCRQVGAWNSKGSDSDMTEMYIRANTKKCPKCKTEIIKDEGCSHMKCTQCAFHFCCTTNANNLCPSVWLPFVCLGFSSYFSCLIDLFLGSL
jgi:hypothetical protein